MMHNSDKQEIQFPFIWAMKRGEGIATPTQPHPDRGTSVDTVTARTKSPAIATLRRRSRLYRRRGRRAGRHRLGAGTRPSDPPRRAAAAAPCQTARRGGRAAGHVTLGTCGRVLQHQTHAEGAGAVLEGAGEGRDAAPCCRHVLLCRPWRPLCCFIVGGYIYQRIKPWRVSTWRSHAVSLACVHGKLMAAAHLQSIKYYVLL